MNTNGDASTGKGERRAFAYSPERRTALVLGGTGAHGAYHAGVLRAFDEAGVKIDVVAGHGVGAASAALAAIGGAPRLWAPDGLWRRRAASFYRWKRPLAAAAWLAAALAVSLAALAVRDGAGPGGSRWLWMLPAAILLALVLTVIGGGLAAPGAGRARRRTRGRPWWRLLGAPLDAQGIRRAFADALSGRYAEVLAENLGQPGFREVMIVATDLDARVDVVAALLREPHQGRFTAPRPGRERGAEIVDLAGPGRDRLVDVVGGALTPPLVCDPQPITFGVDGYWRGETHRLCDRPGAAVRLLEELAAAGVTQAILVSGVPREQKPHRLSSPRLEPRHRLAEFLAAAEAAALRDALEIARLRFDAVYVIAPDHNPVGAFDLEGAYDEASDRMQPLVELMAHAYEDAYHQFIEPVVGASGERLAQAEASARRV